MKVSRMDVEAAYRKLKHYIYYDSQSLLLRQKLVDFESGANFDSALDKLAQSLADFGNMQAKKYFSEIIGRIGSIPYIKKLNSKDYQLSADGLISNQESKLYSVTVQHHIDAPIEIHVLATLWIIRNGYRLEDQINPTPFGNRLERVTESGPVVAGLRMFKKYFDLYQDWRDGAIAEAKKLIEKKTGALLVGLDLKDFYHSVRIDFNTEELARLGSPENYCLNELLRDIHRHYSSLFFSEAAMEESAGFFLLPIGLLSSGVLANWYLRNLDDKLLEILKPSYYGRYVDDLLLVLPCRRLDGLTSVNAILDKFFIKTKLLVAIDRSGNSVASTTEYYVLKDEYQQCLKIQSDKLSVMLFDPNEPIAVLDKFLKEIRRNSSEYKFLPEEEQIHDDFTDSAYTLRYDGSMNKLRSLKEFQEDKFGLSKFLAKSIFLALQLGRDREKEAESAAQLIKVFQWQYHCNPRLLPL